jgi:ornithine cyclodeaminase
MPDKDQLLLLDGPQVTTLLDADLAMAAVREAFVLHSEARGRVFPVVREKLSTGGVFGIKAGDVASQALLGFKAAGFWPANRALGGEPHQATIVLIDPATGRPTCVLDGNAVTTMRTGAAGGWGLDLFARQDSTRLCVFGSGVQARVQVRFALTLRPGLRELRYLTSGGHPDAGFEAHVESLFPGRCDVRHATDKDRAVAGSDIVICATPGHGPLFSASAVQPGTHINAVGTDTKGKRELPAWLLERSRVIVDDAIQSAAIGELQWMPAGFRAIEIGEVLAGSAAFERRAEDITVFDMTGLALQDLTTAREIQRRAAEQGVGTRLAWPW